MPLTRKPADPEPPPICPRCGAALPAKGDACAACLLRLGLERGSSEPGPGDRAAPPMGEPPSLEEVRAAFPGLEVLELLGRGGMGAVFKARQSGLERYVALKVLPRGLGADPAFAQRFLREARALARLSHPGIVAVHDFGAADGLHFLLMEYVDGLDLRHLLRKGLLEPRQALGIARELCEALQYAHDEGVVHRDIKPENVLLDARGRVKIADFGLAKLALGEGEAWLSRSDQVLGTPHYMAPEQLERPREVDHRADIFALGVVLYEMLTGSLPRGRFELPSRRVEVDVRLDEIVLKALEREPERRYQQALEVRTDVDLVASAATLERPLAQPAAPAEPAPRSPRPVRTDPLRGPRALFLLVPMWIGTAALWNLGTIPWGVPAVALSLVLIARLRPFPELVAATAALPLGKRVLNVIAAAALIFLGLWLVGLGHVAHWEGGTAHWHPRHRGELGGARAWQASPHALLRLGGIQPAADLEPELRIERGFTQTTPLGGRLASGPCILAGLLLLSAALAAALDSPAHRRRALRLAAGIGAYNLGALVLVWLGALVLGLRVERMSEGLEREVAAPLDLEAAQRKLRGALYLGSLRVDLEQLLAVDDVRTGETLTQAWLLRAQSDSPFDRWRVGLGGPRRATPQIWATLIEGSAGTAILLRAGLYDASSAELRRARDELARLGRALEQPAAGVPQSE